MKKLLITAALAALCTPAFATDSAMRNATPAEATNYFRSLDKNGDMKVSQDEYNAASTDMFAKADINNDKAISEEEFRTYKMEMKKRIGEDRDDVGVKNH